MNISKIYQLNVENKTTEVLECKDNKVYIKNYFNRNIFFIIIKKDKETKIINIALCLKDGKNFKLTKEGIKLGFIFEHNTLRIYTEEDRRREKIIEKDREAEDKARREAEAEDKARREEEDKEIIFKNNKILNINLEYDFNINDINNTIRGDWLNEFNLINRLKKNNNIFLNREEYSIINNNNTKNINLSICRGNAIKRRNIPRPKYSFVLPYDTNSDGIYCLTKSWMVAMTDKSSLLYPHVYSYELYNEIQKKPKLLLEQKVNIENYNFITEEEVKVLKLKYFPKDSFVVVLAGRIAINSYPSSLLHAIKRMRENGVDIYLLILGKLEVSPYRLSQYEYDELMSYQWVKSFTVPKKEVLNYYRIGDVLASTYRDYCNHVGGCNKIKEFLLCNRPIICSRGKERENELGKDYFGFYECGTCNSVPPLNNTEEFLKNPDIIWNYYNKYFKKLDTYKVNVEINKIVNIISDVLYTKIYKRNYKNKKIGIYQENLAIRSYKLGLSLYLKGYDIVYLYYKYDFAINYESLYTNFYTIKKFSYEEYNEFKDYIKILNDLIFINAWETFAVNTLYYNPCYYIGDLWTLRDKMLKNPESNQSIINEGKIFNASNRLIFSNKYMIKALENKLKKKFQTSSVIQNSLIINENFEPLERDYTYKKNFNLVYIGSITMPNSCHHRNILPILQQIVKYNPNIYIDMYITKFNIDQIRKFNLPSNIRILDTIPQYSITDILCKYDYGLNIFNTNYKDAEYLDISQPNKLFDYYFSNLPIISIHSNSFTDFINTNKIGIIINNFKISLQMLQKVFFSKGKYKSLKSYQTMLLDAYKFNDNKRKYQLYISPALNFFKDIMIQKFNLIDSNLDNNNVKCFFFGIYYSDDLSKMLKFKGEKIYIAGGSDIHQKSIVKNNIKDIQSQNIKIYCQSKYLYDIVLSIYPKHLTYLTPITPVLINNFYDPYNIKGKNIYIYTSHNETSSVKIYGKNIYNKVINKLSYKYNFIIATAKTYTNIKDIYKDCFVGIRLTNFDGLGATNIELGLMGIKCITNNISPNCLHWNNIDDIINHIENESKNIGRTDYVLTRNVKQFINEEHTIFT